MFGNRLVVQLDKEIVLAKASLVFWKEQALQLTNEKLKTSAKLQAGLREADIEQLLKAQEILIGAPHS